MKQKKGKKEGRINEKAALELSIGTIVVIVIAVIMIILGMVLVTTIFKGSKYNVENMNKNVQNEIAGLFDDDKKSFVYLDQDRTAQINPGEDFGLGIGIQNLEDSQEFKYEVEIVEVYGCEVTKKQAENWIITGKYGTINLAKNDKYIGLVKFKVPETIEKNIKCEIRYRINIFSEDGSEYSNEDFYVEVGEGEDDGEVGEEYGCAVCGCNCISNKTKETICPAVYCPIDCKIINGECTKIYINDKAKLKTSCGDGYCNTTIEFGNFAIQDNILPDLSGRTYCPEDCSDNNSTCLKEGEGQALTGEGEKECCHGLKEEYLQHQSIGSPVIKVCTKNMLCGDGRCATGETNYNCPEDCKCGDGICDFNKKEISQTCPQDCYEDSFCGTSLYGSCSSDSDCIIGGCNGEICGSKNQEDNMISTCVILPCHIKPKPLCGCYKGQCEWRYTSITNKEKN
ncbi:MAG: hypothetical protein ABIH37_01780 [archaeon]